MGKIDILKKLIREELRAVIREELPKILKENSSGNGSPKSYQSSILESKNKTKQIPLTLNTSVPKPPVFAGNNPMADLLNETARSLVNSDDTVYFDSSNINASGFDVMRNISSENVSVVEDVNSMLATARPSSNPEMIQINAVPDFSALMNKFKERGEI